MNASQLKTLTVGQKIGYKGMKVICPATKRVLLDCPAGLATVDRVGPGMVGSWMEYYSAGVTLPNGSKVVLMDADQKCLDYYSIQ